MPEERAAATPTVMIDNDRTTVTEWRFPPGGATGWHRHGMDYVVVPIMDGTLRIDLGNGEFMEAELKLGEPYYRDLGVEHDVINANDYEFAFIEVEFK